MRKQLICFIFLFFICLLMPSLAIADFYLDLTKSASPFKVSPLESVTFTLEVREDGSPASGQSVTFSVSPDDGIASLSTTSATTDSNGRAQTTLSLSGNSSESYYEVTARLDNGQGNVPLYGVPVGTVSDDAKLEMYINHLRPYSPGESVAFTFSLRRGGTGVSGKTVTFSLSPNNGTASLSTTSATTDSNGDAGTTVVLGSNASGSYTVTATLDDGQSVSNSTGTVRRPTSQPPDVTLDMSIPSGTIPLTPGESRTFIAIALKDGNYVSGKTVSFSVSPDDGTVSLSTTSATTDSNGEASTTLITSSGSSGSYTVTASAGHSISGTVTVTGSPGGPAPGDSTTGGPVIAKPLPDTSADTNGKQPSKPTNPSDLVVSIPVISKAVLDSGESFTLSVTVGNTGEGLSLETILKYYRSTTDVDVSATQVGSKTVSPIAAMDTKDVSIELNAPDAAGTYVFFACIVSVTDEGDTDFNCTSYSVELTVRGEPQDTSEPQGTSKYDINEDGAVDIEDAALVAAAFGTDTAKYDVNGDGNVDVADLLLIITNRQEAAGAPSVVGMKFTAAQIDRIEAQIALLTATNDRSPAAMQTLAYLRSLIAVARPEKTQLLANYPNPFNPETWIPYRLASAAHVTLTIYDLNGQVVRTLALGHQAAGIYQSRSRAAYWDGRNAFGEPVASGLYFYTLTAGDFTATRKMLIRK